jgi:NifU-like protein involved in Fe-S cluster formation
MNGWSILLGAGILLAVIIAWFAVYYWLTPQVAGPNGQARVVGACGDVMEIRLKFKNERMAEGSPWTSGCVHSFNCVCAAVDLSRGKTPEEILDIDPAMIREAVGGLPREYHHCAALAAETLHSAVDHYMQAGRYKGTSPNVRGRS